MYFQDEDPKYWGRHEKPDLANRVAVLHKQRRDAGKDAASQIVQAVRRAVADLFISGTGLEVGAGPRPFPIPASATCLYGDIRDGEEQNQYFGATSLKGGAFIDAQTFEGVSDDSLDFVISAHVIEHVEDPIGSIGNAIRVLAPGGVYVLAVPDMRHTFDKHRPPTPLAHLIADSKDGGEGTRIAAYVEHLRDVSGKYYGRETPAAALDNKARELAAKNHDIHFHAWTTETFAEMLDHISDRLGFIVVGKTSVANENIFVLRRT